MSCVLIVGIIFGAIGIVKNARAAMKYKGVYISDGGANYLASSYKYDFMSTLSKMGIECYDSEYFWQKEGEDGKTWGEILQENTEAYLKRVIIGSYLFDKNTRLTKDDKAVIEKAVNEVIEYRIDGGRDGFDALADEIGFTLKDFEEAVTMLYKYEMAQTVVFGYDGSALSDGSFSGECDGYFESAYSRVKLMFIRTDGELVTDPETGKEELSEYDDVTRAEVEAKIEYIRLLIANTESGAVAEQMNEEAFDWYITNEYSTGTVNDTEGYYFSSESAYSLEFAKDAGDVVRLALSIDVGEYAECEVDFGVCFIYKCPLEAGAYDRITIAHFFEDFYANAASYIYLQSVDAYLDDVAVKVKYDPSAVVTIPYSYELTVKFG